jgi:exopolyphosphatase
MPLGLSEFWPVCRGHESAASVNEFLTRARTRVLTNANRKQSGDVQVFIGNEAADLDSFVSSIVLAYFSEQDEGVSAPIINCPRADLELRGDVSAVILSTGIDVDNLTFVDDVSEVGPVAKGITLVDHNELAPHQAALAGKVSGIVDHHEDVGSYTRAIPRIIEACGSCSTHVFELCPLVVDEGKGNPTLAVLLLCAVLMDTRNMSKEAGKGTKKDANAIARLSAYLRMDEDAQAALFVNLACKKDEQGHLSTRDILRRDYKQFGTSGISVGIASVGISIQEWIAREKGEEYEFTTELLSTFSNERHIDILLVMSSFTCCTGGYSRELAVWSASGEKSLFVEYVDDIGSYLFFTQKSRC